MVNPATNEIIRTLNPKRFTRDFERRLRVAAASQNYARVAELTAAAYGGATRAEGGLVSVLEFQRLHQKGFNALKAMPSPRRAAVAARTPEELRLVVGDLIGDQTVAAALPMDDVHAIAIAKNVTRLYAQTEGSLLRDISSATAVPVDALQRLVDVAALSAHPQNRADQQTHREENLRAMLNALQQRERVAVLQPPRLLASALPKALGEVEAAYRARQTPLTQGDVTAVQREVLAQFPTLQALLPDDRAQFTEELVSQKLVGRLYPGALAEEVMVRRVKIAAGDAPTAPTTLAHVEAVLQLKKAGWRRLGDRRFPEPDPAYAGHLPDKYMTPVKRDLQRTFQRLADGVRTAERARIIEVGHDFPPVPAGFFS